MNCNEARQHWMLYLDSEGDPELHFRISDHLARCPGCAEWFARQQRLEQALRDRLADGQATPELWGRVLAGVGVQVGRRSRRRWALWGSALAASLLLAAGLLLALNSRVPTGRPAADLPQIAAQWHEQLLVGQVQPEMESTSDQEVDHYLKKRVGFRVHCPPRTDVHFAVKGAGVCLLKDHEQAAYIVGQVGEAKVSILVLDRSSLSAFPYESAQLEGGKRHRCREGSYDMISGIIAENLVLIIGSAPPDALEKLLNAYGSYHEG